MLTKELRVGAFVPYPPGTTPSQRYRIEQWMPYLANHGVRVELLPFADRAMLELLHEPGHRLKKVLTGTQAFLRRVGDLRLARSFDVVVVHRAMSIAGPAVLERLLSLVDIPVIFDFDDAIFLLHTAEANRRVGWLKFPRKTGTICRLSSHVVVGNSFLRDYALRYNSKVTVIPTSVDTARFVPLHDRNGNRNLVVGWTGSSTSQTYLERFSPVLRELAEGGCIELRVHSDRKPELPGVSFVWRPWSPDTEVEEIGHFDIGIMPMPDDDWARGKCAMKALLYMSMGIPAVCSAVGANIELITHGENGLLASTDEEWSRNLHLLADSSTLRQTIGAAGRKTVEERYSMRQSANRFASVVYETLGRSQEVS